MMTNGVKACVSVCPVFALFSFTCLVGLTNALEQDGYISGFMTFYVKKVSIFNMVV